MLSGVELLDQDDTPCAGSVETQKSVLDAAAQNDADGHVKSYNESPLPMLVAYQVPEPPAGSVDISKLVVPKEVCPSATHSDVDGQTMSSSHEE
jgi:hypothetical protein